MGKYVIYTDRAGEYRWRYVANNGNVIADSAEGYVNEADCRRGIGIINNTSDDPVEEQTAGK